jgi:hypothetical protein
MHYDVDVVADQGERVALLRAGYPLLERAMVEEPVPGLVRPATPAAVRVEQRTQTRVQAAVQSDGDGLLVLGDPWYPQWRVEVDGRPSCSASTTPSAGSACPPAATRWSSPTRTEPWPPAWC